MTITKMNWIFISLIFSILLHFCVFLPLVNHKKNIKIERISVINLGQYKQNYIKERKKSSINEEVTNEKNLVPKKKEKTEITKNTESIQKVEKLSKTETKSSEQTLKKDKIKIPVKEDLIKKKSKDSPNNDTINQIEKKAQDNSKQKRIQDQELRSYLLKISKLLNIKALNSYPIQSLRRREEGTIVVRIILDKFGNLINVEITTKRPKRLAKAAKKLITEFKKFDIPPKHVFITEKDLKFEVNLNYRLSN